MRCTNAREKGLCEEHSCYDAMMRRIEQSVSVRYGGARCGGGEHGAQSFRGSTIEYQVCLGEVSMLVVVGQQP